MAKLTPFYHFPVGLLAGALLAWAVSLFLSDDRTAKASISKVGHAARMASPSANKRLTALLQSEPSNAAEFVRIAKEEFPSPETHRNFLGFYVSEHNRPDIALQYFLQFPDLCNLDTSNWQSSILRFAFRSQLSISSEDFRSLARNLDPVILGNALAENDRIRDLSPRDAESVPEKAQAKFEERFAVLLDEGLLTPQLFESMTGLHHIRDLSQELKRRLIDRARTSSDVPDRVVASILPPNVVYLPEPGAVQEGSNTLDLISRIKYGAGVTLKPDEFDRIVGTIQQSEMEISLEFSLKLVEESARQSASSQSGISSSFLWNLLATHSSDPAALAQVFIQNYKDHGNSAEQFLIHLSKDNPEATAEIANKLITDGWVPSEQVLGGLADAVELFDPAAAAAWRSVAGQ